MRFRRWFKSLQQIRLGQIWQRESFKNRRWDHLRADQGALLEIDEGLEAEKIRIDSFAILLNFQKRRQKAHRRDGRWVQIERPVQWWVIAPLHNFSLAWRKSGKIETFKLQVLPLNPLPLNSSKMTNKRIKCQKRVPTLGARWKRIGQGVRI